MAGESVSVPGVLLLTFHGISASCIYIVLLMVTSPPSLSSCDPIFLGGRSQFRLSLFLDLSQGAVFPSVLSSASSLC